MPLIMSYTTTRTRDTHKQDGKMSLTVRLLVTGTSTGTTELLGLGSSRVSNEQGSVVSQESLLELVLGLLIHVLLVEGNNALGNSLTDGVNLRGVSTTGHSDTDVDVGELVQSYQQQRLVNLESDNLRLDQRDGGTVDLDQALSGLDVSHSGGGLLLTKGLDARGSRHYCYSFFR